MSKITKVENNNNKSQHYHIPFEIKDVSYHLSSIFEHTPLNELVLSYQTILADTVLKLTIIPTERSFLGHHSDDDEHSVTEAFASIIDQLAVAFNKSIIQVDKDIKKIMNDFPIDDVREAHLLNRRGLLH